MLAQPLILANVTLCSFRSIITFPVDWQPPRLHRTAPNICVRDRKFQMFDLKPKSDLAITSLSTSAHSLSGILPSATLSNYQIKSSSASLYLQLLNVISQLCLEEDDLEESEAKQHACKTVLYITQLKGPVNVQYLFIKVRLCLANISEPRETPDLPSGL